VTVTFHQPLVGSNTHGKPWSAVISWITFANGSESVVNEPEYTDPRVQLVSTGWNDTLLPLGMFQVAVIETG
jgi:hypothetical protein